MSTAMNDNREQHNSYQRQYFDANVNYFEQPIPDDVEIRLEQIVESANLNENSHVLDIGTGIGALIKHIVLKVPCQNVVGIDLSEQMLTKASKRFPEVRFWQGDVFDFKDAEFQFDTIFFNACFGNLFNPQATLAHVSKFLKVGGCVIISHPLGNKFVACLHDMNPDLVPSLLPEKEILSEWAQNCNLHLAEYSNEADFYLAKLQKK